MDQIVLSNIPVFISRLAVAALLGAAVGYEREFRGKGAGVRTHMLVAIGACMFMLISKFGFVDANRYDAARVAAGVVTGIGFLGAGLIIKSKYNVISGITTAAGLWVTGAIGLCVGSGMLLMSAICAAMVVICLEILNAWHFTLGYRQVTAVFAAKDMDSVTATVEKLGKSVLYFFFDKKDGEYRVEILLRVPKKEKPLDLLARLNEIEGVRLESLD